MYNINTDTIIFILQCRYLQQAIIHTWEEQETLNPMDMMADSVGHIAK